MSWSENSLVRRIGRSRISGNEAAREMWALLDRPPRTVLDYGCGSGRFLARLAQIGVAGTGVDVSPEAVTRARALGLTAFVGDDQNPGVGDARFDLVRLWHVLEHLADPVSALRALRERIASDGEIVVAVPNAASALARIFGADWYQLDAPRHLWAFDERSLRRAFELAGFDVRKVVFNGDAVCIYESIRYALETAGDHTVMPRPPLQTVVEGLSPLAALWNERGVGDSLVLVGSPRRDANAEG